MTTEAGGTSTEKAMDALEKLYQKGTINAEQFRKAQELLSEEFDKVNKQMERGEIVSGKYGQALDEALKKGITRFDEYYKKQDDATKAEAERRKAAGLPEETEEQKRARQRLSFADVEEQERRRALERRTSGAFRFPPTGVFGGTEAEREELRRRELLGGPGVRFAPPTIPLPRPRPTEAGPGELEVPTEGVPTTPQRGNLDLIEEHTKRGADAAEKTAKTTDQPTAPAAPRPALAPFLDPLSGFQMRAPETDVSGAAQRMSSAADSSASSLSKVSSAADSAADALRKVGGGAGAPSAAPGGAAAPPSGALIRNVGDPLTGGTFKIVYPPKQQMGGLIGGVGTGRSDSNLAWVSKGEYVIRADGSNLGDAIRHFAKFQDGGEVDIPPGKTGEFLIQQQKQFEWERTTGQRRPFFPFHLQVQDPMTLPTGPMTPAERIRGVPDWMLSYWGQRPGDVPRTPPKAQIPQPPSEAYPGAEKYQGPAPTQEKAPELSPEEKRRLIEKYGTVPGAPAEVIPTPRPRPAEAEPKVAGRGAAPADLTPDELYRLQRKMRGGVGQKGVVPPEQQKPTPPTPPTPGQEKKPEPPARPTETKPPEITRPPKPPETKPPEIVKPSEPTGPKPPERKYPPPKPGPDYQWINNQWVKIPGTSFVSHAYTPPAVDRPQVARPGMRTTDTPLQPGEEAYTGLEWMDPKYREPELLGKIGSSLGRQSRTISRSIGGESLERHMASIVGLRAGGLVSSALARFANGGLVGGFVNGVRGYAEGGQVVPSTSRDQAASYHALDITTDKGSFRAHISQDTMDALQGSALASKLSRTGEKPSWYS
jgi:hypothetical protein